ncbi:MAG TPA: hypothetical protein VFL57_09895, partial [Bryobacteraceae bacterium]|nr:hypothetical protein [Bryobacteraceae bacterium]
ARPGLTTQQYRSLLINSASAFSIDGGVSTLNVQQGGVGLLNMTAALGETAAALPSTISFGMSGGTVDTSREVRLTNLGPEADAFTVQVERIGSGPAPALSRGYVEIARGSTEQVAVRFNASGLGPGAYQGFIVVRSTRNQRELRLPYWYGVPSDAPRTITQLSDNDPEAPVSSRQQIVFRVTDVNGLPVLIEPTVAVTDGDGRVTAVVSVDDQIPGAWLAVVRLGASRGKNTFRISAGELTRDIAIRGN